MADQSDPVAGPPPRTQLSRLARARREDLGLSLRDVADRTIDAAGQRAFTHNWLARLEQAADNLLTPQEGVLRALAVALELPYAELTTAMAAQFYGVQWVYSEDRAVRTYVAQSDPVSPEQAAELRSVMEKYLPPEK
ncbi:helix-turn-helix domain-containing protein [Streptomyces sp. NPDC101206]|uniref:helix-turn-helix domain-containing protein n=1 Tax=Streptomyces sp. NPDC101206 TaxID=3366128 RepID=UPI0037FAD2BD